MAKKLPKKKLEAMYAAYCEKRSVRHVARKCSVSPTTVTRYRNEEKWDERVDAIEVKAREVQDETELEKRKRRITMGKYLQAKGMEYIRKNGVGSGKVAVNAIVQGVKIEKEAQGENTEGGKFILEIREVE